MTDRIARISRPQDWRHDFIRANGYRCHYCNRFAGTVEVGPDGKPWHVEHMDALANGGADTEENLTLACERCNSLKSTLPYENFRHYARCTLWAGEANRLSLQDLEALEASYLRTTGGNWMSRTVTADSDLTTEVFAIPAGEFDTDLHSQVIARFDSYGTRSGGTHNVRFLIEAQRLMPQLIAEIHLLRAELEAARRESETTASLAA
jgi:hypothetical protein